MQLRICETKAEVGRVAAGMGAKIIREAIERTGEASIILATGASQFEVVDSLAHADVDWGKVTAFHLDEYVGMPATHPASFRRYLRERFVAKLSKPLRAFHEVNGEADTATECARLKRSLEGATIAAAFVGIGENGHLAFNDPPADFETEEPYLVVDLDEACRRQQMGEGWFATFEDVPTRAFSMSIRQIMKSESIICSVPEARKAKAVKAVLEGEVTPSVPASILKEHPDVTLLLDIDSSSLLSVKSG